MQKQKEETPSLFDTRKSSMSNVDIRRNSSDRSQLLRFSRRLGSRTSFAHTAAIEEEVQNVQLKLSVQAILMLCSRPMNKDYGCLTLLFRAHVLLPY